MIEVVGVDGCKEGWVAAAVEGRIVSWQVFHNLGEIVNAFPGVTIAIDTPIGLVDQGKRRADQAARDWLAGQGGSRNSVFFSPTTTHLQHWRDDPVHRTGLHISIQAWHITNKIADVADYGVGPGHAFVIEVHPECSFRALAPGRTFTTKKRSAGRKERIDALSAYFDLPDAADLPRRGVLEDALDATAAAWSALRHRRGTSFTLPTDPAPGEPTITV